MIAIGMRPYGAARLASGAKFCGLLRGSTYCIVKVCLIRLYRGWALLVAHALRQRFGLNLITQEPHRDKFRRPCGCPQPFRCGSGSKKDLYAVKRAHGAK